MGLARKVDLSTDVEADSRGLELSSALFNQFNRYHSEDHWADKNVEEILLRQKKLENSLIGVRSPRPDTTIFSPSGSSKCGRELFYKATGVKGENINYPYQRRWTRNSTAVHEAVQRDLLQMSLTMKDPDFKVHIMENGLPAWEENIKNFKEFEHNDQKFAILGMMDGVLNYKDGSIIGFEFKTKSNSIGQVGNYKMKEPAPYHKQQCVAYSLVFGMTEFILMYEAVAKDQWSKGPEAKPDIRTFYYKVTEEDQKDLLDKFASVTESIKEREIPAQELDKCMFCSYKGICLEGK